MIHRRGSPSQGRIKRSRGKKKVITYTDVQFSTQNRVPTKERPPWFELKLVSFHNLAAREMRGPPKAWGPGQLPNLPIA